MLALSTARSLRQTTAVGRRSYAQVDTRSFYTKYGAYLARPSLSFQSSPVPS